MAEYIVREDTASKLTLETDLSKKKQPTGCLIFLVAFLLIISSLVSLFINQTFGWMSFVLPAFLVIFLIYKRIYPTIKHIVFDFRAGKIIHFNSIGGRIKNSKEMLLSQISHVVYVYSTSQSVSDMAAAIIVSQGNSPLLINEGTQAEIKPFAEKVATSLNIPIEEYGASNSKEYGDWVY